MGVSGNVCCVAAVVKDSLFLQWQARFTHLVFFSSIILSTSLVPASMVVLPNGLI